MSFSLDSAFGIHPYALGVRNARSEILASNLANADTPGYKARDIDFKSALSQAMSNVNPNAVSLTRTDAQHISASSTVRVGNELYRVPLQPDTGDGNTVDLNVERENFLENALMYQTSMEFLNQKIGQLNHALKGDQ